MVAKFIENEILGTSRKCSKDEEKGGTSAGQNSRPGGISENLRPGGMSNSTCRKGDVCVSKGEEAT